MKHTGPIWAAILALAMLAGCAATPGRVFQTKPVESLNLKHESALRGYDPVAYFEDGAPAAGNPAINYQWQGATWYFTTAAHRDKFAADPARYAPQYGGYCAYAISRGKTADADPNQWAIVGGKLYVNNNPLAKALWDQSQHASIVAGNANWPLIPKYAAGNPPPAAEAGSAPAAEASASRSVP